MKLAILLFGVFITGLITFSSTGANIRGTWFVKTATGNCNPTIIRISMQEGVWIGKIDIPEQQVYDKEVYAVTVKGDSVFIKVSKPGNIINAVLKGNNTLTGNLVTDSSTSSIELIKQ